MAGSSQIPESPLPALFRRSAFHVARIVAVALALAAGAVYGAKALMEVRFQAEVTERAERIIAMAGVAPGMPFDEQVDRLREFVSRNSIHEIDDEFYSYWHDLPLVMDRMTAFADGEGLPPHLECASRSEVLEAILARLGYDTRAVVLYEPAEKFPSRTFLEVLNPATRMWQIQDADYDVYWVKRVNGARASVYDLIASPFDAVTPCNSAACGWPILSWEEKDVEKLRTYLGLAVVVDREKGLRPLLVNEARFDLEQPQLVDDESLTYCDYAEENCRQTIERF
jgi:hypothetical protein